MGAAPHAFQKYAQKKYAQKKDSHWLSLLNHDLTGGPLRPLARLRDKLLRSRFSFPSRNLDLRAYVVVG